MTLAKATAIILLMLPGTAVAHAVLVDSAPAANATVPAGHAAMTLRFNSRIDHARSRLTLVAPDHAETRLPITPDGAADVMATTADLRPGEYTMRWQVLALDGHITRGEVPFTATPP
jgi:methionine-rich copper-binding protein CopC